MRNLLSVVIFSALAWPAVLLPRPWHGDAQNTPAVVGTSSEQDENRSFYAGMPVTHPEQLSGIWEARDGHDGAIGIHLSLSTTAPANATTLVGVQQSWLSLGVGIYQRSGPVLQVGEGNDFDDSPRGGSVRYEADRLTLHAPEFDLDLRRIPGNGWSDRFHRKGFDSKVTLTRPGGKGRKKNAWPTGTWKAAGWGPTCLHIAETAPGQFIGWSDNLLAWGAVRFAPNVPRPPYSLELYGDLAKVSTTENGGVLIELNAYSAFCCSQRFPAVSAENGTVMLANRGGDQHKTEWKKMAGDSCIPSAKSKMNSP
jgi:hypothetical protein